MAEELKYPKVRDIFGSMVFDRKTMKEKLTPEVYNQVVAAMEGRQKLDAAAADSVAVAMKDWAIAHGATHWSHWFQPLTELTAEKHSTFTLAGDDGLPIDHFRGRDLVQGEPDASSFPSAGTRSTFEARGYSAWDISSPAFIVSSPKGGTLFIPSVFLSYNGSPLDLKTPMLRAVGALEDRALKLLRLFGQRGIRNVKMTVGAEQEYFLLDRPRAQLRPDIRFCGRTLLGAAPAKDQKLDHHYMGAIPQRVLHYMEDVERDMARLGISIITRHNEVARCQFEFAHLFAEANIACDQNQILMETMRKLAQKHELRLLFHEKPFNDMNGSGKHTNISLMDSEGRNLLKPSTNNRRNVVFLTFLAAVVLGISKYHSLLQVAISTSGNLFRLGGHEAPPSIISVYLGAALTDLLHRIDNADVSMPDKGLMDLGMANLPSITQFDCDRNRTSPVAFTGDKFEFRAPGSSQSIALPVTMFASMWAWGVQWMMDHIEAECASKGIEPIDAALSVVRAAFKEGSNILFEGDAYTPEWAEEARKRGLIQAETVPDKIDLLLLPENRKMLDELGVYKGNELDMLHEIRMESFTRGIEVEAAVLYDMLWEGVLPAISKQLMLEGTSIAMLEGMNADTKPWCDFIAELGRAKTELIIDAGKLNDMRAKMAEMDVRTRADYLVSTVVPMMDTIRAKSDAIELKIAADIWPYPIYRNLLSLSA